MRIDHGTSPDRPKSPSTDELATARLRSKRVSTVVLALLMAGTSWAVASWASIWLVPPYLILMALILSPAPARPSGDRSVEGWDASESLAPASTGEGSDDPDASSEPQGSEDGSEQATATPSARGRRGKARIRKAKPAPEPSEATWIEVAPGKFVRAEVPERSAEAGPHSFEGVPVEVPATPQPSGTDEAQTLGRAETSGSDEAPSGAGSASEAEALAEGPDLDGAGAESESPEALESVAEGSESPGIREWSPAADGNTPQAGGSFEGTEADRPEAIIEAPSDQVEAEPEGEELAFEPTDSPDRADVSLEELVAWGTTGEEADPTEITVDETDLDDAGPIASPLDDLEATSVDDAELLAPTEASPGPSSGSHSWPWRLSPRAGIRVGHPPRTFGREVSPRRLVRSHGPAQRPLDPGRLARRGFGRPRQIIRPFPPRSPPSSEFSAVGGTVARLSGRPSPAFRSGI